MRDIRHGLRTNKSGLLPTLATRPTEVDSVYFSRLAAVGGLIGPKPLQSPKFCVSNSAKCLAGQ